MASRGQALSAVMCAMAILVLVCPGAAKAARSPDLLRGLHAVVLHVDSWGGVPVRGIPTEVRRMLSEAGVKVLDDTDRSAPADAPQLWLTMTLACQDAACGYAVRLELEDGVRLARAPLTAGRAVVWANGIQNAIRRPDTLALPDVYAAESRALVMGFLQDLHEAGRRGR